MVDTPIAAFLTPNKIVRELENLENSSEDQGAQDMKEIHEGSFNLKTLDMILTPGLIRKDVGFVEENRHTHIQGA